MGKKQKIRTKKFVRSVYLDAKYVYEMSGEGVNSYIYNIMVGDISVGIGSWEANA